MRREVSRPYGHEIINSVVRNNGATHRRPRQLNERRPDEAFGQQSIMQIAAPIAALSSARSVRITYHVPNAYCTPHADLPRSILWILRRWINDWLMTCNRTRKADLACFVFRRTWLINTCDGKLYWWLVVEIIQVELWLFYQNELKRLDPDI